MKLRLGLLSPPKLLPFFQSPSHGLVWRWVLGVCCDWTFQSRSITLRVHLPPNSIRPCLLPKVTDLKNERADMWWARRYHIYIQSLADQRVIGEALLSLYTVLRYVFSYVGRRLPKNIGPPASSVYRMMVASRSGLTEIILMGVPVAFSI